MDVLEDEGHIVVTISLLVLDLHFGGTIIASRDVEFLNLLSCEGVDTRFDVVLDFVDFEIHDLVYESAIRVPLRLRMEVNRVLNVLHEHEAFEPDARVALLLLAVVHLSRHPLDKRLVVLETWLYFRKLFLDLESRVILAHLLIKFVKELVSYALQPVVSAILQLDVVRGFLVRQLLHDELIGLLIPLVRDNQAHFRNELVEVRVLDELDKDRCLIRLAENELDELKFLRSRGRSLNLTSDQLLNALQKEDLVRVLPRVEAFFGLDRDLVQVADLDELDYEMVGPPYIPLEEHVLLLEHVEEKEGLLSQRLIFDQARIRTNLDIGAFPWHNTLVHALERLLDRAELGVEVLELIEGLLRVELDDGLALGPEPDLQLGRLALDVTRVFPHDAQHFSLAIVAVFGWHDAEAALFVRSIDFQEGRDTFCVRGEVFIVVALKVNLSHAVILLLLLVIEVHLGILTDLLDQRALHDRVALVIRCFSAICVIYAL